MLRKKQSLDEWTRLWQPAGLSSHWTTEVANRWYLLLLVAVVIVHFILSSTLPLTDDELYYWNWSQSLASGYFDHPLMTAYLIRFSTTIFGDTAFGVRFFASAVSVFTLWLLGRLAPSSSRFVALLALFSPSVLLGGVLMTPDVPLLLFWTLYLTWLIHIHQEYGRWSDDPIARVYRSTPLRAGSWAIGGLILGLGMLSKYTMLLAIPLTFFTFFPQFRLKAFSFGFAVLLSVALVLNIPTIVFNISHDFLPFLFQWEHGMGGSFFQLWSFGRFFSGQVLIFGLLPIVILFPLILHRSALLENPRSKVLVVFFVFTYLFFMYRSLRTYVEPNWPLLAYAVSIPLAQILYDRASFRFLMRFSIFAGFAPAIFISILAIVHLIHPISWFDASRDQVALLSAKHDAFNKAAQFILQSKHPPVFADSYQVISQLRYRGVDTQQLPISRQSQYSLASSDPCLHEQIYTVFLGGSAPKDLACFTKSEVVFEADGSGRGTSLAHATVRLYIR